jgi:hypothetical protein
LKNEVKNGMAVLFCPSLPDIQGSTAVFEGFQTSPACPSDTSNIKMMMIMEH